MRVMGFAILLAATAALAQQSPTQQQPPSEVQDDEPRREGKATPVTQETPMQQPVQNETQNYAPYSIALLPVTPGGEVVLPFLTTENRLAFFPVSQVQLASKEKKLLGRPISYGELIALIGDLQIQVNQLKQENEKLWAVVGRSSTPQTVVVQTPPAPAPNNDALTKYLLLRQMFPSPKPYQLPMPVPPHNGVNCTTNYIGTTAYTNCH